MSTTFIVTNTNDSGLGSLRQAIIDANSSASSGPFDIIFDPGVVGIITLTSGQISINKSMTIHGPGARVLTVSGNNTNRAFEIGVNSINVTINKLSINNCNNISGGSISNIFISTLIINECNFYDNTSGVLGGAIDIQSGAILRLFNSTFNNNSSNVQAGAINFFEGSGIIGNCTFTNNSAAGPGGAIIINSSVLSIINCTIYGNTANQGGGISLANNATLNIGNTIVSNNTAAGDPNIFVSSGNVNSSQPNYGTNFYNNTSGFTPGASDIINPAGPNLLALGNYGGPTDTMLPNSGSPVINVGTNTVFLNAALTNPELGTSFSNYRDQRDFHRFVGTIDIGADEFGSTSVCFSGKSLILTKNIQTNEIAELPAKNVQSDLHHVFDVNTKSFIPIIYNIVTGPMTRFMRIKKDALGENKPNQDFYVTSGHNLWINNLEIKAKNIKVAKRVKVKSQNVYSICTAEKTAILVNNIDVMTWGVDEFVNYSKNNNLLWSNNHILS